MLKAQKLQSKAAKVGFEWKNIQDVLNKLEEELKELLEAVHSGSKENSAEELGDVLFVLVNLGRKMGINSEEALRQCNNKFERRFRGLESDFIQQGRPLSSLLLEEMTDAWIVQRKLKENTSKNSLLHFFTFTLPSNSHNEENSLFLPKYFVLDFRG